MDPYADTGFTKKKFIILVILAIALLALIIIPFLKWHSDEPRINNRNQNQFQAAVESYSPILSANDDPDGDGIPNWLEQLYGTDPNVPDAHKVAGRTSNIINSGDVAIGLDTNLTETIGRDLYVAGSYAVSPGSTMDLSVLGSGLAQDLQGALLPKRLNSLAIIEDTPAATRDYLNEVAEAFLALINSHTYVNQVNAYFEGTGGLATIKSDYQKYVTLCDYLKQDSVPGKYSQLHRDITYECEVQRNIMDAFSKAGTDPVRALTAIGLYTSNMESVVSTLEQYARQTENDNIIFRTNEFGYIFTATLNFNNL